MLHINTCNSGTTIVAIVLKELSEKQNVVLKNTVSEMYLREVMCTEGAFMQF